MPAPVAPRVRAKCARHAGHAYLERTHGMAVTGGEQLHRDAFGQARPTTHSAAALHSPEKLSAGQGTTSRWERNGRETQKRLESEGAQREPEPEVTRTRQRQLAVLVKAHGSISTSPRLVSSPTSSSRSVVASERSTSNSRTM
jgi:hypothetical protein